MRVISKKNLEEAASRYPDARARVAWFLKAIRFECWTCFEDVKSFNAKASSVGDIVVFDLGSMRLLVSIDYADKGSTTRTKPIYFKHLWTHAEYDRWYKSRTPQ